MLKTRGRKRHARSTRKKCIKCTEWIERSRKKRHPCKKGRNTRRMRGGRSDRPTTKTIEGMPVTDSAVVSIPGKGTYGLKAFHEHEIDMDFQGEEQE